MRLSKAEREERAKLKRAIKSGVLEQLFPRTRFPEASKQSLEEIADAYEPLVRHGVVTKTELKEILDEHVRQLSAAASQTRQAGGNP